MKNRISFTMTCFSGLFLGVAVHESLTATALTGIGIGIYLLRPIILRWFS